MEALKRKTQDVFPVADIVRRSLALENFPHDMFLKLPDENMLNWKEILSFHCFKPLFAWLLKYIPNHDTYLKPWNIYSVLPKANDVLYIHPTGQ